MKAIVYIVASKQEQMEKAVEIFRVRCPKVKFAGYRNGYFASMHYSYLYHCIALSSNAPGNL